MFSLKHWSLYQYGAETFATGLVFDNPKFFDYTEITTLRIEKCELRGEALILTTHSGSVYELKSEDCWQSRKGELQECIQALGLSGKVAEDCFIKHKEVIETLRVRADALLSSNELFVQIVGTEAIVAFYKNDNSTEMISIDYHIGTFQDSVLICDDWNVDFRFFPKELNCIEPYHWSDGLQKIYFENVGVDAEFKGSKEIIKLPAGSTTVVESTSYCEKGLFSPDCVNGRSIYNSMVK